MRTVTAHGRARHSVDATGVPASVAATSGLPPVLMPVFRRSLAILAAAILALLPALSASASTADDLEAAKQRVASARSAANDARAAAHDAEVKVQETEDHIAEVEQTISDLKTRAAALHDIVRKRALYAYTHAGNDIDVVVGTD